MWDGPPKINPTLFLPLSSLLRPELSARLFPYGNSDVFFIKTHIQGFNNNVQSQSWKMQPREPQLFHRVLHIQHSGITNSQICRWGWSRRAPLLWLAKFRRHLVRYWSYLRNYLRDRPTSPPTTSGSNYLGKHLWWPNSSKTALSQKSKSAGPLGHPA
jgi:hypothetical protein